MKKIHSIYGCSQQTLYTIAGIVYTNYLANLGVFTSFKGKYTAAYATSGIAAVAAAKALPSKHSRNAIPESIRLQLLPLGNACLSNQRKLKSYIHEVFPGDAATPMLAAAGFNSYYAATHESWEEMNSMITNADSFITSNSVALQAGVTNMPVAFAGTYSTDKTAFETIYNNYLITSQATAGGTTKKISANNDVFTTLMAMMSDGRLIFEDDETKKALFTFSTILANVTGVGTTGMRITATDSISKVKIINLTAIVQPGDEIAESSTDILEIKMPADTYTVLISSPGYKDYTATGVLLSTGVMHRLDVVMIKI